MWPRCLKGGIFINLNLVSHKDRNGWYSDHIRITSKIWVLMIREDDTQTIFAHVEEKQKLGISQQNLFRVWIKRTKNRLGMVRGIMLHSIVYTHISLGMNEIPNNKQALVMGGESSGNFMPKVYRVNIFSPIHCTLYSNQNGSKMTKSCRKIMFENCEVSISLE